MCRKNAVKSILFSLIIFFGLLVIIPSPGYAQNLSLIFGGYPGYSYGKYTGQYSLFGTYDSLSSIMIPYSSIGTQGYIYNGLARSGMTSGVNTMNFLSMMGGTTLLPGNFTVSGMTNGVNITYPFLMMGGLNAFGGLNPVGVGNFAGQVSLSETGNLAGQISLGEPGSLAGLVSLGSNAGLIYTGVVGITTPFGF
jgi:hypothetical protein